MRHLDKWLPATKRETEWLLANVQGASALTVGKSVVVVVPDYDTIDDMLYNEVRSSGMNIERHIFFRNLRTKLLLAETPHAKSHEPIDMTEIEFDSGPYEFSTDHIPDDYFQDDDEEF